jgi:hypothetical protein
MASACIQDFSSARRCTAAQLNVIGYILARELRLIVIRSSEWQIGPAVMTPVHPHGRALPCVDPRGAVVGPMRQWVRATLTYAAIGGTRRCQSCAAW